ncbi:DUF2059 domain-containing protein [Roseovarius aestuarii]|nr:DUF2059 domain-containing protein [Roseovarius aestuarii]
MRWALRLFGLMTALMLVVGPGRAEDHPAQIEALFQALDIAGNADVMRAEGVIYGAQIAQDLMPDADLDSWARTVSDIHDADRMRGVVEQGMREALRDTDLAPLLAFYTAPIGQRIITLELGARRAFMDEAIEADAMAAARQAAVLMDGPRAELRDQIAQMIEDSDLVELNVAGTLNANLLFLRGLVDGGASDLGEDDILGDVWAQEEATRTDTREWLMAFLMLAYAPLDKDELAEYAAMWRTPEGRDLNRALFIGFNRMYDQLSYLLARAAAEHLTSAPL